MSIRSGASKSKAGKSRLGTAVSVWMPIVMGVLGAAPAQAQAWLPLGNVTAQLPDSGQSAPASTLHLTTSDSGLEPLTSVSQLTDVKPTDWAFQAVQSLAERYGCIVGYPDKLFRGDRALTRYEFAAGLNACLDKIQELLAASTADLATKEDLEKVKRLLEDFAPELAVVRGRLGALEVRSETVKQQQFSTTTKLFGQVILGVQGRNSPDITLAGTRSTDRSAQTNVITNVQLSLYTAFSERDWLFTGLQSGTGRSYFQPLSNPTWLSYEDDTRGSLQLSDLTFRHLFGRNVGVLVGAKGVNMINVFRGANRIESAGQGPLSLFAQRNPILNLGAGNGTPDNAGVGFDWQLGTRFSVQGVYFTNRPNDPANGGLFGGENGGTTIAAQLAIAPINTLDITFQYANSYSPSGFLGTGVGDDQVVLPTAIAPFIRAPIQTNAVGGTLSWRVTPRLTWGGWVGYTQSQLKGLSGTVETLNWMTFLNFPDLFGSGNLGGLYVGQPPAIIGSDLPAGRNIPEFVNRGNSAAEAGVQPGRTTHLELFYRYRLNDNISLTPGAIVIFNPNHNPTNDTTIIGILRTTFTF